MKGLLIKDFKLIFGNVKMIVMLIFISIFLMFSQEEGAFTFVVSYMTIITSMFVLSTISYDDFDHGMSYLMTLPLTRKIYAAEKALANSEGAVGVMQDAPILFMHILDAHLANIARIRRLSASLGKKRGTVKLNCKALFLRFTGKNLSFKFMNIAVRISDCI